MRPLPLFRAACIGGLLWVGGPTQQGCASAADPAAADPAQAVLGVWVGESYNGYQVPGTVWDFYPADAFHWDSSSRTLEEYDFEFMPARYVDTRVLGRCRATVSWNGSRYSGDCTYDFVEAGTVDTVGVWGFGPACTGTVEGDMMTLVFATYSITWSGGPDNVLVLRKRP